MREIAVIRVPNRGYGAAANVGFAAARALGAEMVAVLNDDVVVRPDWIPPLAAELASGSGRVGAAQPMLLDADLGHVNSLGVRIGRDGAGVDLGFGDDPPSQPYVAELELFTGGAVLFSCGVPGVDRRVRRALFPVLRGRRPGEAGE